MDRPNCFVLAIDGGAASGKSSTARGIAERFSFLHVDTGTHYRALARMLLDLGVPADASKPVLDEVLSTLSLETLVEGRSALIATQGSAFTAEQLRNAEVNGVVSLYAARPEVRQRLLDYQRAQAQVALDHRFTGVVVDGRDIGTVVFPDANLKVFLEADVEAREARRAKEGIADTVAKRDAIDSTRKAAPLRVAEDALRIDSTDLTLDEVVDRVAEEVEARMASRT